MAETQRVAVLGLGGMGRPMAANILRAGLPTVVWNRRPEPARQLGEQGAEVADNPRDAVRGADVVITMVTDADAVVSIADDQGMLAAMADGAIWVQMSTIGVSATERIARMVHERRPDVVLLDAPVAGSRGPAEKGHLVILASGPEQVRERIAPVFDAIGQRTVRWSRPGPPRNCSGSAGTTTRRSTRSPSPSRTSTWRCVKSTSIGSPWRTAWPRSGNGRRNAGSPTRISP
ncbi:NAD binding domain of 6-phosphogluconate dehydrogenase [Micromonospora rhizosphaerae]|uniref:NAD binding domain of 6-phosphogluconate dehydrogenase n=1 Tax=Micromonospora rhizosphaerae TaxID=568872 RepID=A0A1C6S1Z2_9ACTN|nr:NAD(P)-binding domain-containing protein [Micromonospora rhizosphaerae]SCL23437.1 NAD binding domain of 6-phosphogluconate dehydrogenase [Micromonospora rhizosphaerae]